MPDPKLDIKITTAADTRGAVQAEQALQGVGRQAVDVGKKTQALGTTAKEGFDQFSRAGNNAAAVVTNLESASQGGIAGIFGIANAMRALIGIVRGAVAATGPLGLLVTLLGTGLAAAMAIFGREAKSAGASVDSLAAKSAALAKIQFENLRQQLSLIASAASDATSEFARLASAAQQVDDAETAARIAQIRANPNLSEEDKVRQISAEKSGQSSRSRDRRLGVLEAVDRSAQQAVTDSAATTAQAGEHVQAARNRLNAINESREAKKELFLLRGAVGAGGEVDPTIAKRMEELQGIVDRKTPDSDEDKAAAEAEIKQFEQVVAQGISALQGFNDALIQARRNLLTGRDTELKVAAAEGTQTEAELSMSLASIKTAKPAGEEQAASVGPVQSEVDTSGIKAEIADTSAAEFKLLSSYNDPTRVGLRNRVSELQSTLANMEASNAAIREATQRQASASQRMGDKIKNARP